jgi:hypothetical protein
MTDATEFRKRAKECMDLAPRLGADSRQLIITIAEAWLVLAHAAETKTAVQQTYELENESDKAH